MNNAIDDYSDYAVVYRVNAENGEFVILYEKMDNPEFVYGYNDFYEIESDFYIRGVDEEYVYYLPGEEEYENVPFRQVRLKSVREYFKTNDKAITAYYKEKIGRWLKLIVRKDHDYSEETPFVLYTISECNEEVFQKMKNIIFSSAVSKMYCMVVLVSTDKQQYRCIHCDEGMGIEKGSGTYEEFINDMKRYVFEEDFNIFEGLIKNVNRDMTGFMEQEYRMEDEDGMFHFISAYSTYINVPGGEYILMLCRNIDDHAAYRERIRTLHDKYDRAKNTLFALGNSYIGIYYLNLETGNLITTRQGSDMKSMFGECVDSEVLFDKYINDWVYPDDRKKVYEFSRLDNVRNSLHNKGERIYLEFQRIMGMTYKWVRLEYQAVKCVNGQAVNVIMAFKNIHDEKMNELRAQKELDNALQDAKQASEAKSRFLSNMSHDIRTPMNAIMGMTNIALKHMDDVERVKNCLENISASTEHLLKLVNEVLDMSYIESGKIVLKHECFKISEMLSVVEMIMKEHFESKNQNFDVDITGVVNDDVFADKTRIQQVLINILSNASKYTEDDGNICLKAYQTDTFADSAVYVFSIKDTGRGMAEEFIPKIFEIFERGSVEEKSVEGTGLGMPITKGIVEAMDGNIHVNSLVDQGSEFIVTLPLKFDRTYSSDTHNREQSLTLESLIGKKILVVDDNDINCNIACDYLEDIGVVTDVAINGKEAYNMISSGEYFDLILMDVRMPVMDGYEATRQIREIGTDYCKNIPIIAMTANAFEHDMIMCKEAGMTDYISKPLIVSLFYDIILKNLS